MKQLGWLVVGLALAAGGTLAALAGPAPSRPTAFAQVRKVSLPGDEGWDYLSVDSAARRLYISRSTRVVVVDLETGKAAGELPETAGVHGVALDPELGRGFTSNGRSNSVTIFDLKSLKKIGETSV